MREQVERLEDEADHLGPQDRAPALVEVRDVDAVEEVRPARRAVEAAEDVQQRRLARARRRRRWRRDSRGRASGRRRAARRTRRLGAELARDVPQLDDGHGVGVGRGRGPGGGLGAGAGAGRGPAVRGPPPGASAGSREPDDDEVARPQAAARRAHLGEALGREARVDGHEVDAAPCRTWTRDLPSPPTDSALTGTARTVPFVLLTAIVSFTEAPTSDGRFGRDDGEVEPARVDPVRARPVGRPRHAACAVMPRSWSSMTTGSPTRTSRTSATESASRSPASCC